MTEGTAGMVGASWVNLALGVAIAFAPVYTRASGFAFWNAVVVGSILTVLAGFDLYQETHDRAERVQVPSTINAFVGLWLVVSSFLATASSNYLWLTGVSGVVVVLTSGYNAAQAGRMRGRVPGV